ncbi:MAG: hypothetical protein ACLT3Y_01160 [Ruminococcus callidus]
MKNLKKPAVLAAAITMSAVAVTTCIFRICCRRCNIIANVSLKGQMGGYQYWGEGDERNTDDITSTPAKSQMKMVSTLQPGTSQVTVPAQSIRCWNLILLMTTSSLLTPIRK